MIIDVAEIHAVKLISKKYANCKREENRGKTEKSAVGGRKVYQKTLKYDTLRRCSVKRL